MGTNIVIPDNPHRAANTGDGAEFGDNLSVAFTKVNNLVNAAGTTTVNFGAAPGATDATAVITGQTGIVAGSVLDAWVMATATADHSADEHWVDPPQITVGNIVAGTGFTIYAKATGPGGGIDSKLGGDSGAPLAYGLWSVAWNFIP